MKGLLIDLGNTVWYNKNFDFELGLEAVYNEAINPTICLEELKSFARQIRKNTYDNREEKEISFEFYLNYLTKYFNLEFNKSNEELEYIFASNCENIELINGIVDVLKFCKDENIKVIALSNSSFSSKTLTRQAKDLGIDQYFSLIISSGDHMFRKPSLEYFNLGIKAMGLDKTDIVFLGNDFYFDIYGASRAGLNSIWYNEQKIRGLSSKGYLDISNYQELLDYLKIRK